MRALQRRKTREAQGFFLAEGVRVAEELVSSNIDLRLAIVATTLEDTPRGHELQSRLASRSPIHRIEERALRALAATEHPQGVLVIARVPQASLSDAKIDSTARVLVSDGVQDPGNLGTLIRVADAFAAAAVILLPGSVDPWNPKVVRSAAGSSFHLPVITAEVAELSLWLREYGFHTVGAAVEGEPLEDGNLPRRVALIVGNEGAGLRVETKGLLDRLVRIDTPGHAESLNVAVAAGILMYRITKGVS